VAALLPTAGQSFADTEVPQMQKQLLPDGVYFDDDDDA
jgi:hypothetical protein